MTRVLGNQQLAVHHLHVDMATATVLLLDDLFRVGEVTVETVNVLRRPHAVARANGEEHVFVADEHPCRERLVAAKLVDVGHSKAFAIFVVGGHFAVAGDVHGAVVAGVVHFRVRAVIRHRPLGLDAAVQADDADTILVLE